MFSCDTSAWTLGCTHVTNCRMSYVLRLTPGLVLRQGAKLGDKLKHKPFIDKGLSCNP